MRHNVRTLCELARPAELWAVVKADGYGHGARAVAGAALEAGANALCVATADEARELRRAFSDARLLVLGTTSAAEHELVREARAELVVGSGPRPRGIPLHLKIDTGMGRAGIRAEEALGAPSEGLVGALTHLAVADDPDQDSFTHEQLRRFAEVADSIPGVTRHAANSAATIRIPSSRLDAVRCGIAIYGLSPFADRAAGVELLPALSWHSTVQAVKTLQPGESTGYGRRFIAERPTRIGLVPVGYADGFRRGLRGTEVLVDGVRRTVVGTPSMDSFAVEVGEAAAGATVTIIGEGIAAEEHARALGTINYELVCGIGKDPTRCERVIIDG